VKIMKIMKSTLMMAVAAAVVTSVPGPAQAQVTGFLFSLGATAGNALVKAAVEAATAPKAKDSDAVATAPAPAASAALTPSAEAMLSALSKPDAALSPELQALKLKMAAAMMAQTAADKPKEGATAVGLAGLLAAVGQQYGPVGRLSAMMAVNAAQGVAKLAGAFDKKAVEGAMASAAGDSASNAAKSAVDEAAKEIADGKPRVE
jgi:hypothetical protein